MTNTTNIADIIALLKTLEPDELENVFAWVNGFKTGCERKNNSQAEETTKSA